MNSETTKKKSKPVPCPKCEKKVLLDTHTEVECLNTRLDKALRDNTMLKESVENWKDAWFKQREITGELSWSVPNPMSLKDSESPFFKKQYSIFVDYSHKVNLLKE